MNKITKDDKVLQIIDHLGPGGAQVVAIGIAKKLKNVTLIALRRSSTELLFAESIIYESTKYSLYPIFLILKYIDINDIGILHCHLARSNVFGWIIKLLRPKLKLIIHEHGEIIALDSNSVLGNFLYILSLRLSQRHVYKYIAVSEVIKKELLLKIGMPESQVSVLHNFVDVIKYKSRKKTVEYSNLLCNILDISDNEYLIGFAGRLIERKGWRQLIEAVELLKNEGVKVRCFLAGDGPQYSEVKALIKNLDLEERINMLGYVSDMPSFYEALDCFVNPSHWEAMGLTHLEAMAMNKPVILSDIPVYREIIMEDGQVYFFTQKSAQSLAEAIRKSYIDFNKKMVNTPTARTQALRFSLDAYQGSIVSIYNNIR